VQARNKQKTDLEGEATLERRVRVFCESANGISGIPRYIQMLAKHLAGATNSTEVNLQLSARWLHRIPELDILGVHYKTNGLPGRLQNYMRKKGIPDQLLYGSSQVVHELNYMLPQVSKQTRVIMTAYDIGWRLNKVDYGLSSDFISQAEKGLRRANRIITLTESVKNDIVSILGVSSQKVTVISPGLADVFLSTEQMDSSQKLPDKYWLCVGAITPRKNIDSVIDVLATMEDRLPLVIAGPDTDFLNELSRRAEEKGVHLIHIAGTTDQELVQIYKGCTGLIYPSYWEGFGFPIVEAAACGVPVITSDNTSMREIGEGYASLVDPGDTTNIAHAMRMVANATGNRETLRLRGRVLAERYSWGNTADKHLEVYQNELERYLSKFKLA